MYFTNLRSDGNRHIATCLAVLNRVQKLLLLVDTGAAYTCCSSSFIDLDLTEQDMIEAGTTIRKAHTLNNEDKNKPIKLYKYHLKQFTIGNIDLGERDIWITFDNRFESAVLGMDILQHTNFLQVADSGKLIFFKTFDEMADYIKLEDVAK